MKCCVPLVNIIDLHIVMYTKKASQITNADKIRSMTDEELAVFLDEFSGRCMDCEKLGPDTGCPIYKGGVFCLPCDVMDWLKQPAKEE